MQITISATLTEEQLNILGAYKGFSEGNKEEFIMNVYQSMIINDATNVFIDYSRKQTEQARLDEENAIREQVKSSISSSIGD